MKVVFLSNYFNHHQRMLSDALYSFFDSYSFMETQVMEDERKNMGWSLKQYPSYVVTVDDFEAHRYKYQREINEADVVIIGSAPNKLVEKRRKDKKLTFRYSERPLKKGIEPLKFIPRYLKWRVKAIDGNNTYMLCASAYTAADYAKFGLFKNKCYKWGYFPETVIYKDIDELISQKKKNSILWVARMIDWKHPEVAVEVAKRLKKDGYDFELNIIGTGTLENQIKESIISDGLDDCVHMLGSMPPEQVRVHMEQSEIFIFTSDRNEGWGAVLNESMNSACAVVASHAIGSVPYLVDDKKNGLIYKDGDIEDIYNKTKWLFDNLEERKNIAKEAYRTIVNEWNAENAAKKFIALADRILNGEKSPDIYDSGVCSKAESLKNNWYNKST